MCSAMNARTRMASSALRVLWLMSIGVSLDRAVALRAQSSAIPAGVGYLTWPCKQVPLCFVERLREVRDQIGRMLDADRQTDRGLENAYSLPDVGRNARVGHASRVARQRLGAAETHRQLEDFQRV